MSLALHSSVAAAPLAARLFLPLPSPAGVPSSTCPYCGAPPVGLDQPRSFTCGASWSGPRGSTPCGSPPAMVLLQRLRAWCLQQELYAAAAFLRRFLRSGGRSVPCCATPGWLLPSGCYHRPPPKCPCCGAPTGSCDEGTWYYQCGCLLMAVGFPGSAARRWVACMPCQRPSVTRLLQAMNVLPDNPLSWEQQAKLLRLLVQDCWI